MRVSALQPAIRSGDRRYNMDAMAALVVEAMRDAPDVLVLPELWDVGYPPDIADRGDPDGTEARTFLAEQARLHGVNIVGGSIARAGGEGLWNTAYAFDRQGRQLSAYDKTHLFTYTGEEKVFKAGSTPARYSLDGVPSASVTCYEIRFCEWIRVQALDGINLLFVPALWGYPRLNHWRLLIQARAVENALFVIGVNAAGQEGKTRWCGHSLIVSPWGEILAEADDNEAVIGAELNLNQITEVRDTINVFRDRRPELYAGAAK